MFNPATLAQNAEAAKDVDAALVGGGDCVLEMKLDGIRLLAWVTESGVRTFTRSGKEQTGKLPAVEAELAANLPAGTWVDGEVVAIRISEDGGVEHHWGTAQSVMGANTDKAALRSGAVSFSVFDVMAIGGTDARSLPFRSRRKLLEQAFDQGSYEACVLTPQLPATAASLDGILAAGFEGAMVKRLDAPYTSGRGRNWVKIKHTATEDVIITGLPLDGNGKYEGQVGAVVFSQIKDGVLVEMGRCSGMDDAERLDLSTNPDAWLGTVIEVKHFGVMPSGGWRHPNWYRARTDKTAAECVA